MFVNTSTPWTLLALTAQSYVDKTLAGWPYKLALSPLFIFYGQFLGGDGYILVAFYALFFLDLAVGLASAVKRQCFSMARLDLWIIKLLVYSVCILIVGFINAAIARSWGFHPPVLDTIMTILIASEALSLFANLQELTGKVPPVLLRLAEKVQSRANRRLDDMLDNKEEPK